MSTNFKLSAYRHKEISYIVPITISDDLGQLLVIVKTNIKFCLQNIISGLQVLKPAHESVTDQVRLMFINILLI